MLCSKANVLDSVAVGFNIILTQVVIKLLEKSYIYKDRVSPKPGAKPTA